MSYVRSENKSFKSTFNVYTCERLLDQMEELNYGTLNLNRCSVPQNVQLSFSRYFILLTTRAIHEYLGQTGGV